MGIEKRRKTIGGSTYELTTLGTKTGQKVLLRLFRILGPAAAEFMNGGEGRIGSALSLASSGASDDDLEFVCTTFAGQCEVIMIATGGNGETSEIPTALSKKYDSHFAGAWDEWALWIGWNVKENFNSFFSGKGLDGIIAKIAAVQASESKSPKP